MKGCEKQEKKTVWTSVPRHGSARKKGPEDIRGVATEKSQKDGWLGSAKDRPKNQAPAQEKKHERVEDWGAQRNPLRVASVPGPHPNGVCGKGAIRSGKNSRWLTTACKCKTEARRRGRKRHAKGGQEAGG